MFRLMHVFPGASVNRLDHPHGGCWFIMPLCLAGWFFSLSFFHSDVVLLVSCHMSYTLAKFPFWILMFISGIQSLKLTVQRRMEAMDSIQCNILCA
jgi:hypothetical protein